MTSKTFQKRLREDKTAGLMSVYRSHFICPTRRDIPTFNAFRILILGGISLDTDPPPHPPTPSPKTDTAGEVNIAKRWRWY